VLKRFSQTSSEHAVSTPAVEIQGIGKRYVIGGTAATGQLRERLAARARHAWLRMQSAGARGPGGAPTFWALRDVTLNVNRGEVMGILGGNGSGKSTLLKILSRITSPTEGRSVIRGRVGSLLEVGTGFHQELSGRDNVYLNGAILGMRRSEIAAKFDQIVEFAEVTRFIDTPVKHYSSGMQMRLAFAVAAHLDTDILMVDEVLAVGDAAFQRRCLGTMDALVRSGRTILFVSHNLDAIQRLCATGLLLNQGRVVRQGKIDEVLSEYRRQSGPEGQYGTFISSGRLANGWAQIADMRVVQSDRQPRGVVSASDDLMLDVDLATLPHARESLRGLMLEINVKSEEGAPLLSIMNVDDGGAELPSEQTCTLRLRLPGPVLAPGRYYVSATLATPDETVVDELRDCLEIRFDDPDRPWRPFPLHASRGVVCRIAEWRVQAPVSR
jgi:lipopolysaccharide transport system ATP-binding protein